MRTLALLLVLTAGCGGCPPATEPPPPEPDAGACVVRCYEVPPELGPDGGFIGGFSWSCSSCPDAGT